MSKYITLVEGDLVCNIPKGTTNGEVIRAIFPNIEWQTLGKETQYEWEYTPDTYVADLDGTKTFIPAEIWNASYKKGGAE